MEDQIERVGAEISSIPPVLPSAFLLVVLSELLITFKGEMAKT